MRTLSVSRPATIRVNTICGLSLLLVLSFAPKSFFPGTPVFPSPQKPALPNSNSTMNQVDEEPLCGCATSKSLFIYLSVTDVAYLKLTKATTLLDFVMYYLLHDLVVMKEPL